MPQLSIPLIKGDRTEKLDYRNSLPVNMTAVIRSIKGDDGYLLTHDGLEQFALTSGVARGGTFNERFNNHFRVSGDSFEEVEADGTVNPVGFIAGTKVCSFANSFNTQAIVSDGRFYLYDNATLTEVVDPDLGFPIDIAWFNGIYVFTDGESLYQTDISDEYSISPLKFTSSEFASDPVKGIARNDQNQIVAFNRYSTEYFVFDPTQDVNTTVLRRINGKTAKIGIVGTHCKAEMDGVFFILGGRKEESPSVHILVNGQETTVATREVDKIISQYSEIELINVFMEARVVDRDKFIYIYLPCETLIYNHTVGSSVGIASAWTFVKTDGIDKNGSRIQEPWRAKYGLFDPRISAWIYGDIKENKLGKLTTETAAQYDEDVESIFYTPIINGLETASIDSIEIDTIPGYSSKPISNAFSISYDGVIYSQEYWNKISTPQDYNKRYIIRRLGYIRNDFNMKFRFISRDKMAFSGAKISYG